MSVENYPKIYKKVQSEMGAYGKANPDIMASASEDKIADAIDVAIMMGGGPAVVYGSAALEAFKQFQLDK